MNRKYTFGAAAAVAAAGESPDPGLWMTSMWAASAAVRSSTPYPEGDTIPRFLSVPPFEEPYP